LSNRGSLPFSGDSEDTALVVRGFDFHAQWGYTVRGAQEGAMFGMFGKWAKKRVRLLALIVLVLALVILACSVPVSPAPEPTKSGPTDTPPPTNTLQPTNTPTPAFERAAAQVVEVVDGDTIEVRVGGTVYTVCYIGIDAPETVHPSEPVEWMGPEASAANRQLVEGQTVYLEKDVSETDEYGRLLRYVFLADGTFVNAELVRLGYAQVDTVPPDVRYQSLLLEAQREAREAERGLWAPTPTPLPMPTATYAFPTVTSQPTEPPTATPIPVVPTNTPASPFSTNTPAPPLSTNTPASPLSTNTPAPPLPTNTPAPPLPTNAPAPSPSPEPEPICECGPDMI